MRINIVSAGIWGVSGIILCILGYGQEWGLFSGVLLLDFLFFYQQKCMGQAYARELEKITDALDQMFLGKDISIPAEHADTLPAKILAQIHRIHAANKGCQSLLQREKEGIKKLLAEISHQLRTPLANMESYLALLEDEAYGNGQKEYLEAVKCSEEKIKFLTEHKIFQIYYRGKNVSGEEGYGMGLFITREIIKKHDGFLKAKRRDQGLSISIFLPKTGTCG